MLSIEKVVKSDLCIGCMACTSLVPEGSFKNNGKMLVPDFNDEVLSAHSSMREFNKICPGTGYSMLDTKVQNKVVDKYFGQYDSYLAASYDDVDHIRKASSGGIMSGFAMFLLDEKIVDGVIATEFEYGVGTVVPKPRIYTSSTSLKKSQGSKYTPVPIFTILPEMLKFNGKLLFIGTPCQIAALNELRKKYVELDDKLLFTFGNFCGGFRDIREMKKFIKISGNSGEKLTNFQFRGDGQPGKMIIDSKKEKWEANYPEYADLTGYKKYYRCRVCIDATAELADISFGDAWIPRLLDSKRPWSIVLRRNPELGALWDSFVQKRPVLQAEISYDEMYSSQRGNLTSKIDRNPNRYKTFKSLGFTLPQFEVSSKYGITNGSFSLNELRIYVSQILIEYLEQLRIFKIYYYAKKYIRKKRNESN